MPNVYHVEVNGNAWNIEASNLATAVNRGVRAEDRSRKEKGQKGIDTMLGWLEVNVRLVKKNTTLERYKAKATK